MSQILEIPTPSYKEFETFNLYNFNNPGYSRVNNLITAKDMAKYLLRDLQVNASDADSIIEANRNGSVSDPSIFSALELSDRTYRITKLPIQLVADDVDLRPQLMGRIPDEMLSWVGPSQSSAVYPLFNFGVLFFSLAMPPGVTKS